MPLTTSTPTATKAVTEASASRARLKKRKPTRLSGKLRVQTTSAVASSWCSPGSTAETLNKVPSGISLPTARAILTVELNFGQMVEDVRLALNGRLPVRFYGFGGGWVPDCESVSQVINDLAAEVGL